MSQGPHLLIMEQELAILGLSVGDALPTGGQQLGGRVSGGSGTAGDHTKLFVAEFRRRWGIGIEPGSLNVNLGKRAEWEEPRELVSGWEFVPVILNGDQAVGVAFRQNRVREDLLEIASPVKLRARLGCPEPEEMSVSVRLLSGLLLSGS